MRVLPVPYGLLAHELVEVIDQERIMPGITWIGKFAEDYPFLDHHSTLKEKSSLSAPEVTNPHQHVHTVASGDTRDLLQSLTCSRTKEVAFYQYNFVRYTFLQNLLKAYKMDQDKKDSPHTFEQYLQQLQSSYIWNVYKILTQEYMQEVQYVPFKDRQESFLPKVLAPLMQTLRQKVHSAVGKEDKDLNQL